MSYDIYLRSVPCAHCGRIGDEPDLPDPTYNLTPIFDLALTGEPLPNPEVSEAGVVLLREKTDRPRGLRVLDGNIAADTVPQIEAALARLVEPEWRERFKALEPDNGWGDLDGAIKVMRILLDNAKDYPSNTWEIH